MKDTVHDDHILQYLEHDDVREALQVDLPVRSTPLGKTFRAFAEERELLLHLVVELLTKAISLILVPEVGVDEFLAGQVPDLDPVAHPFFALRAISRTSSQE